jgi:hypothetical protein
MPAHIGVPTPWKHHELLVAIKDGLYGEFVKPLVEIGLFEVNENGTAVGVDRFHSNANFKRMADFTRTAFPDVSRVMLKELEIPRVRSRGRDEHGFILAQRATKVHECERARLYLGPFLSEIDYERKRIGKLTLRDIWDIEERQFKAQLSGRPGIYYRRSPKNRLCYIGVTGDLAKRDHSNADHHLRAVWIYPTLELARKVENRFHATSHIKANMRRAGIRSRGKYEYKGTREATEELCDLFAGCEYFQTARGAMMRVHVSQR